MSELPPHDRGLPPVASEQQIAGCETPYRPNDAWLQLTDDQRESIQLSFWGDSKIELTETFHQTAPMNAQTVGDYLLWRDLKFTRLWISYRDRKVADMARRG